MWRLLEGVSAPEVKKAKHDPKKKYKRERKFLDNWREGREWLVYDAVSAF